MVNRSWFYRNGLFYTILALVLLIHLILLILRMQRNAFIVDRDGPSSRVLKVQVLKDDSSVRKKQQIVQSEDTESLERPEKDAYLSDKNRRTDRQTVAKVVDRFNEEGGGAGAKSGKKFKDLSLSDLSAFKKGYHPLKEAARGKHSRKMATAGSGNRQDRRGVSSTNDFVEGVPLGDLTYLNTVEYKYYGFFHRIRQKLEQFWGSSIQEMAEGLAKQKRRLASGENLITSLEVTLNEVGEVVGIKIKGTSGIQELDDVAVQSFNEAGPFPNPPKGLIKNGLVKIEWGFVVNPT